VTGRARRWATLVLGLSVSAFFLWITLRRVELDSVAAALASVSLPILSLALLTKGIQFLALGLRSRFTVGPFKPVAYGTLVASQLLGYTGNNVLPFRLGEVLRIDYLARRSGVGRAELVGTVVAERLMDTVALLLLFVATVPLVLGGETLEGRIPWMAGLTVVAFVTGIGLTRWDGLGPLVETLLRPVHEPTAVLVREKLEAAVTGLVSLADARWTPGAALATVLYWTAALASLRIVLSAFDLALPWYAPLLILALTALGTALPSSPGFVGTYHYFSALGVSLLGVDTVTATSFALVAHAMATVPWTVVGLLVFARSMGVWVGEARGRRDGRTPPRSGSVGEPAGAPEEVR